MNPCLLLPDFNSLVVLHQRDPDAFETLRRRLLRQAVNDAPATCRPQLENLLLQIECARRTAQHPYDAAFSAFRLMQDSLSQLHHSWKQAHRASARLQAALLIEHARRQ